MIIDSHNRIHDYLRISLTDNCNFRCLYCMPNEVYDFAPPAQLMQAHEIETLAKVFVAQGVKKIRLTGGEPLIRKDAAEIISSLGKLPVELAITTNGSRIDALLPVLLAANIQTLNISLDTLQSDKFARITQRNQFAQVRRNIELLLKHNLRVKINMVVMKGFNEDEILDFIAWTKSAPIQVRFIEFMPFSENRWTSHQVFPMQDILNIIASQYNFVAEKGNTHDTARHFTLPDHAGSFAIISTMSAPFCAGCNRIRLTADGKLKNCLFSTTETDLLAALRRGEDVLPLIETSIKGKAKELGGQFSADFEKLEPSTLHNRTMIAIGG